MVSGVEPAGGSEGAELGSYCPSPSWLGPQGRVGARGSRGCKLWRPANSQRQSPWLLQPGCPFAAPLCAPCQSWATASAKGPSTRLDTGEPPCLGQMLAFFPGDPALL